MERKQTFEFDDEEIHVIAEALMLMGDESDIEAVRNNASTAKSMFFEFFELDNEQKWEEACARFEETHGRPLDVNDVSDFDWFKHQHE